MNNRKRKIIFLFPLLIYFMSALTGCTSSQERRILVVHSYEETYAAYPDFNHLIAKQFRKKGFVRISGHSIWIANLSGKIRNWKG